MVDLSIVTVTWNNAAEIGPCLDAVLATIGKHVSLAWYIVDNGSSDETVRLVRTICPHVKVIENRENLGYAAANNQALEIAGSKYLLLLNPDTVVFDDALNQMIQFMESNPDVGAVGPRLLRPDGSSQYSCTRYASVGAVLKGFLTRGGYLPEDLEQPTPVEGLSGAALMVRASLLPSIGLLDEDYFMYGEDTDWCYRFHKADWKVCYLPTARILHLGGASARRVPVKTYVRRRAAKLLFVEKHRARWQKQTLSQLFLLNIWLRKMTSSESDKEYYDRVLDLYRSIMNRNGQSLYSF